MQRLAKLWRPAGREGEPPSRSPTSLPERVTRRRADAQARFAQAQRLNDMGELAVVLAHELNQPLSAISSYAAAGLRRSGEDEEFAEILRKVAEQAARASEIVSRIRDGTHRAPIAVGPQALPELVAEAIDLAMTDIARESVVLHYAFDDAAKLVLADRLQVQQVLVNLVRNALEAMAASPWRELRIGAQPDGPDHVRLHVIDNGPGLAGHMLERLFQPFVTDKPAGMGVGLAISRGIVEAHGGRLWAERASGGGAAFYFTLRRAPAPRPVMETARRGYPAAGQPRAAAP
jgi:two-component system sensor kinase FixL